MGNMFSDYAPTASNPSGIARAKPPQQYAASQPGAPAPGGQGAYGQSQGRQAAQQQQFAAGQPGAPQQQYRSLGRVRPAAAAQPAPPNQYGAAARGAAGAAMGGGPWTGSQQQQQPQYRSLGRVKPAAPAGPSAGPIQQLAQQPAGQQYAAAGQMQQAAPQQQYAAGQQQNQQSHQAAQMQAFGQPQYQSLGRVKPAAPAPAAAPIEAGQGGAYFGHRDEGNGADSSSYPWGSGSGGQQSW